MGDDADAEDAELPGTPESRKADADLVRERTADAVRRLRRVVGEARKVIRDRFQTLPLRYGSEPHRIATRKLFNAANVINIVLMNLPRTRQIDGTFGESILTWNGLSVPQEHAEDYISAVSWLREAADELMALTSDKQGVPDVTSIPDDLVRGLESAERMLAFAETEGDSPGAVDAPSSSSLLTDETRPVRKPPKCPTDWATDDMSDAPLHDPFFVSIESIGMPDVPLTDSAEENLRLLHHAALCAVGSLYEQVDLAKKETVLCARGKPNSARTLNRELLGLTRSLRIFESYMLNVGQKGVISEALGEGWQSVAARCGLSPLIEWNGQRAACWHWLLESMVTCSDLCPHFELEDVSEGWPVRCSPRMMEFLESPEVSSNLRSWVMQYDWTRLLNGEVRQLVELEFVAALQHVRQYSKASPTSIGQDFPPLPAASSTGEKRAKDVAETAKRVALMLGGDGPKIMAVVSHLKFTTEQKLGALVKLDDRFKGYKSKDLAELLSVSEPSIRNSSAWKEWHPKPAKSVKSPPK